MQSVGHNNSFKPTPHRGVNSVLYATLHAVATPLWGGLTPALDAMERELQLPDGAAEDSEALEIARIWVTRSDLLVSLNVGLYAAEASATETTAWGDILADTIKHLASAISLRYDMSPAMAQKEILVRCTDSLASYDKTFAGELKSGI